MGSVEDVDGLRCVDLVTDGATWLWRECRRDPEDSHGWRPTGAAGEGFATQAAARADAARRFDWMKDE
jgi:hypothetical protein